MAKKATTKATKTDTAARGLKFAKGAYYLDRSGDLWFCTNGKTKKVNDDQTAITMKRTWLGEAVGDDTEQLAELFVKHLTASELEEYRAVTHREHEAENESKTTKVETKAPAKGKAKKAKVATDKTKKMSALDAAAKVLGEATEPMATKGMIEAMSAKGYWTSPGGQTPSATLYAAILREINLKGVESRFAKTDRGRFALQAAASAPKSAPKIAKAE